MQPSKIYAHAVSLAAEGIRGDRKVKLGDTNYLIRLTTVRKDTCTPEQRRVQIEVFSGDSRKPVLCGEYNPGSSS